ncbi:MAG TPA: PhzF family phenazine biosynthesis protein [Hanamia sp.]|nr:PhzF family phenazine biosynthesis protein [Hanamia sp.]
MKLKIYQVDAFTSHLFGGNPAAVCPLESWLSDELMQKIAMENNLAETAFYVKNKDRYDIRWFTPTVEVDLCGHATLATAFVLFNYEGHQAKEIIFGSLRSGVLKVKKQNDLLTLDFPTDKVESTVLSTELLNCFNTKPREAFKGKTDYMLLFNSEEEIRNLQPNLPEISKLKARGLIATAKGNEVDFVSRFFGPQSGVNEDPVTGSAHTTLIPYWANKTAKNDLSAFQLSARKGFLKCKYAGDRVEISGQCRLYLSGEIFTK